MNFYKRLTLAFLCSFLIFTGYVYSADLKILIMQDDKGAAEKYQPLVGYFKKNGLSATLVSAPNYTQAAKMFLNGEADAMFSGSGIAGTLIIKDLAVPTVRPLSKDGFSTYRAVILAKKGSPKYAGNAKYFEGKKVIFTALASSGEFFYRAIPNIKKINVNIVTAASHGAAIEALSRGVADIAIVKDRIWEKRKAEFPGIEKVGEDSAENPDMALMVSKKLNKELITKITSLLLNIKDDNSLEAVELKSKLNAQSFIKTTEQDFKHTLNLLKKAGVTKDFEYKF